MKGKGEKGNRSAFSSSQTDDGTLSFTTLKSFDHLKSCPLFTSIANRDEDEYVSMDELEGLQSELESILSSMNKRAKALQAELQNLNNSIEKGKDKLGSSPSGTLTPQSTGSMPSSVEQNNLGSHKRSGKGKSTEERPAKRMRTDSGRATYAQPLTSKGKGKHNNIQEGSDCPVTKLPKNITPGRFWAMVEPYCADVMRDDLRFLEDQIKFCEDIGEVMKIPALGRHYEERWMEEDLMSELGNEEKRASDFNSLSVADGNPNKNHGEIEAVSSLYGPLTQRLIQSLLEANNGSDQDFIISDADAYEAATIPPKHLAKQLHIKNPDEMERRIRRELRNQGIFDPEDSEEDDEPPRNGKHANNNVDNNNVSNINNLNIKNANNNKEDGGNDEVLMELRKKQQELKVLSQQNCQVLGELLKLGREEMVKQELKKKLAAADAEIEETYKRLQSCKVKKKTPNKKDKEAFFKALQDRKNISKQLHQCSD